MEGTLIVNREIGGMNDPENTTADSAETTGVADDTTGNRR